jgi:hypothetical protein
MGKMNAILIRCGIDKTRGGWNAPVDVNGNFVYVPIPEKRKLRFRSGLERRYGEVLPALHRICSNQGCEFRHLRFPPGLLEAPMHLDPDFECLTYGNPANTKGRALQGLQAGDLVVFYAGLCPMEPCEQKLIYALVGILAVRDILTASELPPERWYENAHVRKRDTCPTDIIVCGASTGSGRFDRCISIGEWRTGAYRVRAELLDKWGGLSVKDGFITRSAVPPRFLKPRLFMDWLSGQGVQLMQRNN